MAAERVGGEALSRPKLRVRHPDEDSLLFRRVISGARAVPEAKNTGLRKRVHVAVFMVSRPGSAGRPGMAMLSLK
jgi:hypothetical protein